MRLINACRPATSRAGWTHLLRCRGARQDDGAGGAASDSTVRFRSCTEEPPTNTHAPHLLRSHGGAQNAPSMLLKKPNDLWLVRLGDTPGFPPRALGGTGGGLSRGTLGTPWRTPQGGRVTAMRGRKQETGPEGPQEEDLDDQRGPKGTQKRTQGQPTFRQVTHGTL
jgi:hypothetical protein